MIRLFCVFFVLFISPGIIWATPPSTNPSGKIALCAACHGIDGHSVSGIGPHLAGQSEKYLYQELIAFKSGERKNPLMMGVLTDLTPADFKAMAAYFAQQKRGKPLLVKVETSAARLYRQGDAKRGIAACTACHGPTALGNGPAGFPALAGQQALYLSKQLAAFASGERKSQTGIMTTVSRALTPTEQVALATYLSSLSKE